LSLREQARVCAVHLAERGTARYRTPLSATQLEVGGVRVFSAGDLRGGAGCHSITLRDPARGIYKRLVLRENRIEGALLYGDTADARWYRDFITEHRDVGEMRDTLLFAAAQLAGPPQ
jgi:nitrite reductase (NADH) large subunit